MLDTLKNTSVGTSGFLLQFIEIVPEIVKVGVGIATICYLIVQIRKDYRPKE